MFNKIILMGNIGRAPRLSLTQNGRNVASFSLATSTSWKDENGEWQSATEWHRVTVFRESTISWIKDALKRGDRACIEGKLSYQHWTDKYGQARITPHIVISDNDGRIKGPIRTQEQNGEAENTDPEDEQLLDEDETSRSVPEDNLDEPLSTPPYRPLDPANVNEQENPYDEK